jgi:hypothetical protein
MTTGTRTDRKVERETYTAEASISPLLLLATTTTSTSSSSSSSSNTRNLSQIGQCPGKDSKSGAFRVHVIKVIV